MVNLTFYAESNVPTRYGAVTVRVYRETETANWVEPKEHLAIIVGDRNQLQRDNVLARVHSECWTGETLGSLKCDCREQFDLALERIAREGTGVMIYLRQEGRGIGLGNKIRAYALQEQGADTVEANEKLGFAADLRSYGLAAAILQDLGVSSVVLMTNNPQKIDGLVSSGVPVVSRMAHWGTTNEFNEAYLTIKQTKLGHQT